MGKVWAVSARAGRYRSLYSAMRYVFSRASADAEIIALMYATMSAGLIFLFVNNRKS